MTGRSSFAQQLEDAAAQKIYLAMLRVAGSAEGYAKDTAGRLLVPRSGLRHKDGDGHLLDGIHVEVQWPGSGFPVTMIGRVDGPPGKTAALEWGARPHKISAKNAPFLMFPQNAGVERATHFGPTTSGVVFIEAKKRKSTLRAQQQAGGGRPLTKTKQVNHPGNRPYGFLRKGLNRAVREALAQARVH